MSKSQAERLILLMLLLIVSVFFIFGAVIYPVSRDLWLVVMLTLCAAAIGVAVVGGK